MQLENGWLEVLKLVALFLLKTEICDTKNSWKFFLDAIVCLVKISFEKRGTSTKSVWWMEVLLSCPVFSVKLFFLYFELYSPNVSDYLVSCNWSFGQKYPFRQEIVRRQFSSICASTFTNVLALHFNLKFDLKLAVLKLESSKGYLLKLLLTFFVNMRF